MISRKGNGDRMNPRKRKEYMWGIGFVFIVIASSLYALWATSFQRTINVLIVAVITLIICAACFFIKNLPPLWEQAILIIATVFFIVSQGFIIHSFALMPICLVAVGVYVLPIFHWRSIFLYSILGTCVLVMDMVMSVIDPTYLSRVEKATF